MSRAVADYGPFALSILGALVAALAIRVFADQMSAQRLAGYAGLAGLLLLAVPAARLNAQGRVISGLDDIIHEASRPSAADAADDDDVVKIRTETRKNLAAQKGSWTRQVEWCFRLGYALMAFAAILRV